MDNLFVEIVAPSGRIFQGEAQGVQAPGVEGSFEVLLNHAPMIAAFEIGQIRLTLPDGEHILFATSGGFIEVLNNNISILAETAESGSEIDLERAQLAEKRALEKLDAARNQEEREAYEAALNRARNRVRSSMGAVGRDRKF
ncbi:MAG: ATP synthase F1 subunit epsilon [Rhodothermales bacterium]|nr:ATP synthase F1 subunit epsilon [Rhodothermales bacterium]